LKYKNIKVAEILDVTKETITNWIKLYLSKGFDGLCSLNYDGRRVSKLVKYNDIIKNLSTEGAFTIVKELKHILKDIYGLEVCRSWLSEYLKKNRSLIQKNSFNTRRKEGT
jgi:transposase